MENLTSLTVLITFFIFIFGTIIGSFLNVVILRYNTGVSVAGRSACFCCGKKLLWFELVPVISFIFLRGKCGGCSGRISIQYPLVELATGFLFVGTFYKLYSVGSLAELLEISFYFLVFALLVIIAVYDLKHKIIPNGPIYSFIFLSLSKIFFTVFREWNFWLIDWKFVLAGPVLSFFFFLLWFLSKGKWMGFGDVKFALGAGWLLGMTEGIVAVVFSFWIGAAISLTLLFFTKIVSEKISRKIALFLGCKHLTIKSEVPFAPFLILGILIVFFFNFDLSALDFLVYL